jgi:hypothetical protein
VENYPDLLETPLAETPLAETILKSVESETHRRLRERVVSIDKQSHMGWFSPMPGLLFNNHEVKIDPKPRNE